MYLSLPADSPVLGAAAVVAAVPSAMAGDAASDPLGVVGGSGGSASDAAAMGNGRGGGGRRRAPTDDEVADARRLDVVLALLLRHFRRVPTFRVLLAVGCGLVTSARVATPPRQALM